MSTPPTTQLVQGAFYSALDQQANATLSLKQLTALDWPTLIAAQAAFTPSAFYLDNAIPVSVPLRPTAAPADAYLPSDFSVALAANTLLSWALAVPLLLTSVADEFGSADGQLNPVAVPAPYYAAELAQFIGETTKVEAILSSAEYALGTGDDAVRDALNKVRGVPSSLSLDRDADHAPPHALARSAPRASGRARSATSRPCGPPEAAKSLSASSRPARPTRTTRRLRTAPAASATRTTSS